MPWIILVACCALWGTPAFKKCLNELFSGVTFTTTLLGSPFAGTLSLPYWDMPALPQPGAAHAARCAGQRQARGGALHDQLAVGRGHRRFVAALLSGLVLA
jgi:lactate permease